MLPSFCKDTVTVQRATLIELRGSKVPYWDNPRTFDIAGCSVQSRDTVQDRAGRTLQIGETWRLYAPPGADIQEGDRVAYEGHVFEVDGAPMPKKSPTGRVSHIVCTLRDWSG